MTITNGQYSAPAQPTYGRGTYVPAPPTAAPSPRRRVALPPSLTPRSLSVVIALSILSFLAVVISFGIIGDLIEETYAAFEKESGMVFEHSVGIAKLAIVALIPAIVILAIVRWIDRWEPEPIAIYVFCLLWGGGVAIVAAFIMNGAWDEFVYDWVRNDHLLGSAYASEFQADGSFGDGIDFLLYQIVSVAIGAGIVEEGVKGVGLIIIFYALRRYLNGPIDGMVYGLLIGTGFAFTENILYFGRVEVQHDIFDQVGAAGDVPTLIDIFVIRGVGAPFLHPICTAATGIFIGLAANQRRAHAYLWPLTFLGFGIGAGIHAMHNFTAVIGFAVSVPARILVQLPLYAGAIAVIVLLMHTQRVTVHRGLKLLSVDGAITPDEISLVMDPGTREHMVAGLDGRIEDARRSVRAYERELIQAGYYRSIFEDSSKRADSRLVQRETKRIADIQRLRQTLAA